MSGAQGVPPGPSVPFEWQIGWRYLRAGRRASRRNRFVSFIAGVSVLGIALGVAALVIVLSVMNGFQQEVRARMLDVIAHVELLSPTGEALPDWRGLAAQARQLPQVVGAAPGIAAQVLLGRDERLRGALLRGIDPAAEAAVTTLVARSTSKAATPPATPPGAAPAPAAPFDALRPGARGLVIGRELARALALRPGDAVAVVLPVRGEQGDALPRSVAFTVAGVFDAGHYEYDSALAFTHLDDAAALFDLAGPTAVRLRLADPLDAPAVARTLARQLGGAPIVRDWTLANRTWFEAVHLQKRMLGLILVLIVAVAAFNLVSTLVMTVTEKRADIAILRTLGAGPRSIMAIFFVQGAAAGVLGTAGGVGLGLAIALHLDTLVPALERLLGTRLLPASVYFIDHMPSQPLATDIVPIALASLALAFVATLYPSWRASRVQPAVELRGE